MGEPRRGCMSVGAYRIRPASECVRVLIGRPKDATPAAGCRRDLAVGERSVTHGKRPLQKNASAQDANFATATEGGHLPSKMANYA